MKTTTSSRLDKLEKRIGSPDDDPNGVIVILDLDADPEQIRERNERSRGRGLLIRVAIPGGDE